MRWSVFLLGAVSTVVGPRVLKSVVRTAAKGVAAARKEMATAMIEVEKEVEAKRSVTTGPTGQA
jgi:Sec-independent protein translocase protein TatA